MTFPPRDTFCLFHTSWSPMVECFISRFYHQTFCNCYGYCCIAKCSSSNLQITTGSARKTFFNYFFGQNGPGPITGSTIERTHQHSHGSSEGKISWILGRAKLKYGAMRVRISCLHSSRIVSFGPYAKRLYAALFPSIPRRHGSLSTRNVTTNWREMFGSFGRNSGCHIVILDGSDLSREGFNSKFEGYYAWKYAIGDSDDIKGVGWFDISILSSLPNLNPRPLRISEISDINTTHLPYFIFPICPTYVGDAVTTSITPSLVARGERNIHPMMYQLYLCAVY